MRPTLAEIEATVGRLEARLAQAPADDIRRMLDVYRRLEVRLRADLDDPRDLALSRGAALMLIKFMGEPG